MATGEERGESNDVSPPRVGARLRAAREDAGLDLGDVAARTRIPVRHLEAIERSDYSDLPAPTYAVGFARSYARAIGADEVEVARDLRVELGREPVRRPDTQPYLPVDPTRIPSRLLAWTTFAIAAAFLIGWLVWRNLFFSDTPGPAPLPRAPVARLSTMGASAGGTPGPVVLTATSPVWVQITDASGDKLVQHEMKQGESFAVPPTSEHPVMATGRPNALRITVGGREVPPLGPPERRIKDVDISATALAARLTTGQNAAGNGSGSVGGTR